MNSGAIVILMQPIHCHEEMHKNMAHKRVLDQLRPDNNQPTALQAFLQGNNISETRELLNHACKCLKKYNTYSQIDTAAKPGDPPQWSELSRSFSSSAIAR